MIRYKKVLTLTFRRNALHGGVHLVTLLPIALGRDVPGATAQVFFQAFLLEYVPRIDKHFGIAA